MFSYNEIIEQYPLMPIILGTALAFWTYYVFNVAKVGSGSWNVAETRDHSGVFIDFLFNILELMCRIAIWEGKGLWDIQM